MSKSLAEFNEKMKLYSDMIEKRLDTLLNKPEEELDNKVIDAMRYSVLGGGKRIRGVLVLSFSEICGLQPEKAIDFACALEMIHAYSLIHDDLPCMDDDDIRRGKPSCHIKFGEAIALLAGDALLTKAFEVISCADLPDKNKIEAIMHLSKACGDNGMIYGQMIDLSLEGNEIDINNRQTAELALNKLHNLKTAELICASTKLGVIAAGANKHYIQNADKFGNKIGLSFQFIDDILDFTSDTDVLGKPVGSDAKNSKLTSISLYGKDKAYTIAQKLTNDAIKDLECFDGNSDFLVELCNVLLSREK